ncbi:hypothetical protein KUCAC02_024938 [Chaenocephalus aceratus]|nr:hypothetical protein KUCAC02_024938 [Chaenocephalus aceratus]
MENIDEYIWQRRIHHGVRQQERHRPIPRISEGWFGLQWSVGKEGQVGSEAAHKRCDAGALRICKNCDAVRDVFLVGNAGLQL